MIVISGCPRSGTSLMTNLIQTGLDDGPKRLVGSQFMGMETKGKLHKIPNEPKVLTNCRKYIQTLWSKNAMDENKKSSIDMNPDGFWECKYTVPGCFYQFNNIDDLRKFELEKQGLQKDSICKIVSQGLVNSDPRYISKVVFMMRHPRAVAKSQERLKRRGNPLINEENRIIHTPSMFINVTMAAIRWFKEYTDIPVLVIDYDELLNDSETQLKRLFEFLGEGDISKTEGIIKPKLRRSWPEEIEMDLWKEAEQVHKWFIDKEFDKAIKYIKSWDTFLHRERMSWVCSRINEHVNYNHCEACKKNKEIVELFKVTADIKNIKWKEEPCLYDCGYNITSKEKPITPNQSVENHSWIIN